MCFCGEVLKVIDILLEPIVRGSIFVLSGSLDEFGQVSSRSYLGIEGVKILIVVFNEFLEGFILGFEHGAFHLIVPFLREGNAFSGSHFAEDEGDFKLVGVVDTRVDQEVSIHGFEPS